MPELVWEGKYDSLSRVSFPFHTDEIIGESDWRNRLVWGDKKYVLPSLLNEFANKIDLIYIDPPFGTNRDFYSSDKLAYSDRWDSFDAYLSWMHETLTFLRELLSESGSIFVHCDDTASHYIKIAMDDIFGSDNYRNEIAWYYRRWNIAGKKFARNHDVLFFYTKSHSGYTFNQLYIPKSEKSSAQGFAWQSVIGDDNVRRSYKNKKSDKRSANA